MPEEFDINEQTDVTVDESAESVPSTDTEQIESVDGGNVQEPIKETPAESQPDSKAYQEMRERLQRLEQEKQREAQEKEFYRQMAFQNQSQKQPDPEPAYDPDDFAQMGQVEKVVEQRLQGLSQNMRQIEIDRQEQIARQQYSDFDEAIEYTKELIAKGVVPFDSIKNAQNPVELAYLLGTSHPSYQTKLKDKIKQEATKEITSKIQGNLSTPKTLSNASASSTKSITKDFENMSDAEFEAYLRKVKGY